MIKKIRIRTSDRKFRNSESELSESSDIRKFGYPNSGYPFFWIRVWVAIFKTSGYSDTRNSEILYMYFKILIDILYTIYNCFLFLYVENDTSRSPITTCHAYRQKYLRYLPKLNEFIILGFHLQFICNFKYY